jgi:hypothetical protein
VKNYDALPNFVPQGKVGQTPALMTKAISEYEERLSVDA